MTNRPIITLLTDFGTKDPYVAAMKGVILSRQPDVTLVDLTHEVPPQDIVAGAFILAEVRPFFPDGTIHLAVVDPGVGTERRALAAQALGCFWVGPDNGLFHLIFQESDPLDIVSLENPRYFQDTVSPTFQGRDLFAPVAAHLTLGTGLADLGPPITDPAVIPWPQAVFTPEAVRGEIVYVDGFGNLLSNIKGKDLLAWGKEKSYLVILGSLTLEGLSRTYGDVLSGQFLALIGSHGYLEIACALGNAARRLGVGRGRSLAVVRS